MADLIESLTREAQALEAASTALRVPVSVLLGEAVDVTGFTRRFWRTELTAGGVVHRPGLDQAGDAKLPLGVLDEIAALEGLTYQSHRTYMLEAGPAQGDDARAREVLSELTAALEWAFDDDVEDAWDERLRTLRDQHEARTGSQDGLALALDDYASLAEHAAAQLAAIPAFDVGLVAEARSEARAQRERSVPRDAGAAARHLDLRNRFAALLYGRIQRVRRAARYVFRHHPEIVRQVTSTYERRKRAESRRRAAAPVAS